MFSLEKMIDFVKKNNNYEFIPELWSDFNEFKAKRFYEFSSSSIDSFLQTMVRYEEGDQKVILSKNC